MCGIAGIVYFSEKKVEASEIGNMLNKIKHRGPDDEGMLLKDNIGLGHVRLSIIDLSAAGHQPMFSNDQRYSIIFNGEIYNYLELKEELSGKYEFKTKTDTEVLLAAYIVWGEPFLAKLNGDFSFVIYDAQEKVLFGARDRFGIKPFYYHHNDSSFSFASEIKALLPRVGHLKPNNKSIFEYLIYNRTDQSHETFFDSVFKLKHGHCFTIKGTKVEIKKWYTLKDHIQYPTPISPQAYKEEFKKAIAFRLRSDVPIGVCLSGGIDSSSLVSVLYHDFNIKGLKTFSAVFEKGTWADESHFIDEFRPLLSNMYSVTPTAETFYNEFTDFITSQCEPIPGVSPYAQYKVMKLAKGNVSVTLDGQGADEMLGGYGYFYGSYFKELLKSMKLIRLLRESSGYLKNSESKEAFKYFMYYLLPLGLKSYAGKRTYGSVHADFFNEYNKQSTLDADLYNPSSLNESFLQHFEYKLEHLLKWDDLNSMSFSIESRVPFLDHNFVEKTLSIPADEILKNGVTKYILREAVKDVLPPKIYNRRDKKGFETPADEWFRDKAFQNYIHEMLDSASFKSRGYFNVKDCKQKYQDHLDRKTNIAKDIWKWINLEVWFRTFIDKDMAIRSK